MKDIPVRKIRQSDNPEALPGKFSIRKLQEVLKGQDLVHDLHRHDFYFVLAVIQGTGTHDIDFISHPVKGHSLFILRPGQVHHLLLHADSRGFIMEFDHAFYHPREKLAKQRLIRAGSKNVCSVDPLRAAKIQWILDDIYNEFNEKNEDFIDAIRSNLDIFFIEVVRQSQNTNSAIKKRNTYTQDRFEEFMTLLEKNIETQKQVAYYADSLNLSNYQLNAITKESVGKPVSQLINEQSILEAKRLLLATSNQVKDVAYNLGYEDISYFIRFFRKHTGQSPEAFRKQFQ